MITAFLSAANLPLKKIRAAIAATVWFAKSFHTFSLFLFYHCAFNNQYGLGGRTLQENDEQ